ncbi:hypothetical protein CsSME_00029643 [Camellia sinensis var. sinensis]
MVDDMPHNGAPPKAPPVFPPITEVEEPAVAEAGGAAEDIKADLEAEFAQEFEPEPLPLRVRPFDPATYHPCTHILLPRGIRRFNDFARGVPEDLLLRKPDSHISSSATEGDSRAYRGYGATTARDWYDELPVGIRDIIDEAGIGLFCSGLTRVIASRLLLGALAERWWDTTNSFHLSAAREITMTPYGFAMITGCVGGDLIPFDTDMGESEPKTLEEMEQYTRGFLMFVLGTTLFSNGWNIVGLYLLSTLVTLSRLWVYKYFPALALEPMEELPLVVSYLRRYNGWCWHWSCETFAFFCHYFDTMAAHKITWQPWATMPAGVRDHYAGAWGTSRFQILLEGPVCQAWFLS